MGRQHTLHTGLYMRTTQVEGLNKLQAAIIPKTAGQRRVRYSLPVRGRKRWRAWESTQTVQEGRAISLVTRQARTCQ